MTVYEIITVVLGTVSVLISFGSLVVALLSFLEKRNEKQK